MLGRIATFQSVTPLIERNMQTQAKIAEAQAEQASGLRSETYSGIASDTSALLSLNRQTSALNADAAKAQGFSQIVDASYSTLGDIADLAASMRSTLAAQQSNATLDADTLSSTASQWLSDLQSLMNTKSGDSYLFSGTNSATAPVDLSSYSPTTSSSDTSYYRGATKSLSLALSTGQNISLGVNADSAGFEKILRAAALIRDSNGDSDTVSAAFDLLEDGVSDLGSAQETTATAASALERSESQRTAQLTALDNFASDLKGADLTDATVRVTQYQTQLQAAYSSLTVLLKISLLNYL